jgi:diaminopimelate epimerase
MIAYNAPFATKINEEPKLTMRSVEQEIFASYTRLYDCFPGGNDTFIVLNESFEREQYARINQLVLDRYKKFEQGAVLEVSRNGAVLRMQMTGGEFCGNATRSAAALIAQTYVTTQELSAVADYSVIQERGNLLTFPLEVSGTGSLITARVTKGLGGWDVEIELPRMERKDVEYNVPLSLGDATIPCTVVNLEGISHVLIPESKLPFSNDQELFRMMVADVISQLQWGDKPAFGLIWVKDEGAQLAIEPVVYVKSIQTCIYESACGSGTIAVALAFGDEGRCSAASVKQPSGVVLTAAIDQSDEERGIGAKLSGPVEIRGDLNERPTRIAVNA